MYPQNPRPRRDAKDGRGAVSGYTRPGAVSGDTARPARQVPGRGRSGAGKASRPLRPCGRQLVVYGPEKPQKCLRFVPAHSRRMGRKYNKKTATGSIELNKIDNEKFILALRPCDRSRPCNRGDPPAQALGTATTRLAAHLPPLPRGGAASASPLPRCCPVTDQGSPRPGRVAASCDRPRSSSAQRASLADGSGLAWPCFRALVSERRSTQRFGPIGALGHTSQRFGARAARSPRVESDSRDRPGSPAGERGRRYTAVPGGGLALALSGCDQRRHA